MMNDRLEFSFRNHFFSVSLNAFDVVMSGHYFFIFRNLKVMQLKLFSYSIVYTQ